MDYKENKKRIYQSEVARYLKLQQQSKVRTTQKAYTPLEFQHNVATQRVFNQQSAPKKVSVKKKSRKKRKLNHSTNNTKSVQIFSTFKRQKLT